MAKQVPEKNIILNDGCCPIHAKITATQLQSEKSKHPNALVLTHPECEAEVVEMSDFAGSTAEIIDFARVSKCTDFIICTEDGVDYKLVTDNPDKRFYYPNPHPCCADMKLNTLEAVLAVLKKEDKEITVAKMYNIPQYQVEKRRGDFGIKQLGCTLNRMEREDETAQIFKEILRIVSNEYNNGNIPHTNSTPLNSEKEFLYMKATGIVRRIEEYGIIGQKSEKPHKPHKQ